MPPSPLLLWITACQPPTGNADPTLGETVAVVPGPGLPAEVTPQDANNNLDIAWFDHRLFLAFRTAPSHFASADTVMVVMSSEDQQTWTLEAQISLDTDLREPRFLELDGQLILYFAVLGDDAFDFEPQGARRITRRALGDWSAPEEVFYPGFIPWRTHVIDGVATVLGYTGGENIYDAGAEPVTVYWLKTEDGSTFEPYLPDQPVVLMGGGSETDLAFTPEGALIAVSRNEAGDETGFGSKICRAEPGALGDWRCVADPKKYDSPLVFEHGGQIWLVGRRNLTETGAYDLGLTGDLATQSAAYALDYWQQPKRCSLWRIDEHTLAVDLVLDLPSAGDTCFASIWHTSPWTSEIYNYSSPVDQPDLSWLEGQTGETLIYRTELRW